MLTGFDDAFLAVICITVLTSILAGIIGTDLHAFQAAALFALTAIFFSLKFAADKLLYQCFVDAAVINPDGMVYPCVYWNKSDITINELEVLNEKTFSNIHVIPQVCENCEHKLLCAGGCEGRRVYRGMNLADELCPIARGKTLVIPYKLGDKKELIHSNYLCTLILSV